ncbi:molybdate ABC transporter substrate-binding protein [Oscillatoria sp. CS-180]|uniref:molybdate ABC transporter substrate-binding protein n=1 Tax=Oscillatoria sp. CS-180 TaxID=3021720 RepID=UPI00232F658B|nr:molybdate ABC transporter substrate-binding protein [Oscillatoria sp. CS-180]MDB9527250.1 molybdate ABC transporter substrate-binding protein [Oscillatoria sp. CS-180]
MTKVGQRRFAALVGLILSTSLTVMSCAQTNVPTAPDTMPEATTTELTVSVAASVQDVMQAVQAAYQVEAPTISITYNFGSSGSLAQQIIQGAPTDIFLSASQKWMDDVEAKGLIEEDSRHNLLLNALVLIVPLETTKLTDLSDLTPDKVNRVSIGEPESVPAGRYSKEALASLGLFDALQPKMVFGKDVRQVLSYVETGNVDAGLVYATDANVSERVQRVATIPAESHSPIVYPIALIADRENSEAAQDFVDFLSSDTATAIFEEYGFAMAE